MKCIQCGTDNNRRDWNQYYGKCKKCSHRFVFEPSRYGSSKLTDQLFAHAIAQISANNTLYFTVGQFEYFVARQLISDTKPRITQFRNFKIKNISFTYCLFISYLLFLLYAILNIAIRLLLANIISGFIPFNLKFFLFLMASLLVCTWNIKFLSSSSSSDEVRCKKLQDNSNPTTVLIKDTFAIFIGVIVSQLFYYPDKSSYFWLGLIAIFLGRYISIVAIYVGDIIKNNRVVTEVTQKIYNPGLTEKETVRLSLHKWQTINGKIEKLLSNTSQETTRFITPSSDITAYSFDSLVVCDNDNIAKFLIANNFHFEKNCAILSITGYPHNIFEVTMQMLRRNPDLKVYALHNCSPKGVSLAHQLRTDERWFRDSDVTIVDVGILPRQVFNSRKIWITRLEVLASQAKNLPPEIQQSLNSEELKWLMEGNSVDLESLPPQKLIQILNQTMATNQNLAFSERDLIILDTSSHLSFYGDESFG